MLRYFLSIAIIVSGTIVNAMHKKRECENIPLLVEPPLSTKERKFLLMYSDVINGKVQGSYDEISIRALKLHYEARGDDFFVERYSDMLGFLKNREVLRKYQEHIEITKRLLEEKRFGMAIAQFSFVQQSLESSHSGFTVLDDVVKNMREEVEQLKEQLPEEYKESLQKKLTPYYSPLLAVLPDNLQGEQKDVEMAAI